MIYRKVRAMKSRKVRESRGISKLIKTYQFHEVLKK
jgi:hypothetical protein